MQTNSHAMGIFASLSNQGDNDLLACKELRYVKIVVNTSHENKLKGIEGRRTRALRNSGAAMKITS